MRVTKNAADFYFSADPRCLAHCRYCHEPMYCIYDATLRDFCYPCELEARLQNALDIKAEVAGGWRP